MSSAVMRSETFRLSNGCEKIIGIRRGNRMNLRVLINETDRGKSEVKYCLRELTEVGRIESQTRGRDKFALNPRVEEETDE